MRGGADGGEAGGSDAAELHRTEHAPKGIRTEQNPAPSPIPGGLGGRGPVLSNLVAQEKKDRKKKGKIFVITEEKL